MIQPTKQPLAAVLFDLDGTLVATGPEIADAINDTLLALGLERIDDNTIANWVGHGSAELLKSALGHALQMDREATMAWPRHTEATTLLRGFYEERTGTRSHLYDGVVETLQKLKSSGIKLGVCTNKDTVYALKVLRVNDLEGYFDVITCGDTYKTKKPDPSGLLKSIDTLGVNLDTTLFVGDSSVDVATARNAGVPVWAFDFGYNMGADIKESHPDRLCSHFADLQALIG